MTHRHGTYDLTIDHWGYIIEPGYRHEIDLQLSRVYAPHGDLHAVARGDLHIVVRHGPAGHCCALETWEKTCQRVMESLCEWGVPIGTWEDWLALWFPARETYR